MVRARGEGRSECVLCNLQGKIPVKWTAPEALERRVFTSKSDV